MTKWKMLREGVAVGAIAGLIGVPMFLVGQAATGEDRRFADRCLADYHDYLARRDHYDLRDQAIRDRIFEWRLAYFGIIPPSG
jgi:hypothetical protein